MPVPEVQYLGLPDLTTTKFVENWFVDPKKWVEEDKIESRIRVDRSHGGNSGAVHATDLIDQVI